MEFKVSEVWKTTYPGAGAGILAMRDVSNPQHHPLLDRRKKELEDNLRASFSCTDRSALKDIPVVQAYNSYYKRYRKTYHVQLQLESVVFKEKPIPRVAALVEAMFIAELRNLLLTAGHDLDVLQMPVKIDVAEGSEKYTGINGQEQRLKSGDMMIADNQGIISSILYGPDYRTRIGSKTRGVLFTVYAPPGIEEQAVWNHLKDIQANVEVFSPEAKVETMEVFTA